MHLVFNFFSKYFIYSTKCDNKVVLSNQIALILACAAAPYGLLFFGGGYYLLAWLIVPTVLVLAFIPFLNALGLRFLSRYVLVVHCNIAVLVFSQAFGEASGIHFVFFAIAGLPLIIFSWSEYISRFALFLLSPIFLYIGKYGFRFIPLQNLSVTYANLIYIAASVLTFLIVALAFIFYQRIQEDIQLELTTALKNSETMYDELQTQQKLLEKTWQDSVYATLTRTIAHELKNPLFEFGMVIAALRTSLDDRETALVFIDSLGETINELMELLHAMLESGGASIGESKEIQISDVMRRVLILAEGSMRKRNIRIHKEFEELPIIMGDSKSYLMIFSNLIVNAMEAMSDDDGPGGDLTVRLMKDMSPKEGFYGIVVEISDSGVGIPRSRQDSLFKGGQSTKAIEERQRGIGLALVWKLVAQMGGTITVHSDPDVKPGTMFRICV
jgi:signal transduction histidine kinase